MISFKEENKKFNFRVSAIVLNKNKTKVLLHTIKGYDFYLLPGGRVEWFEDCKTAIKRELKEEIALVDIEPKERLFMENFFIFNNVEFQEIAMNFVVELDEKHKKLEELEEFCGIEGEKYLYRWVDLKDIDDYIVKPYVLKKIIKNFSKGFEYLIFNER